MKKNALLKWLVTMLIFLLISCENLPTKIKKFQQEISIVSIINTSNQPQKVHAFFTATPAGETGFIENAVVQIYNQNQTIIFNLCTDTLNCSFFYCDRPETLHVIPEMKYHLRFVTAAGDSVVGETIVPGKFTIITPTARSITVDNFLLIEWTKSKSAYGYIINLNYPPTEYPPGSGNFIYHMPESFQTRDTTYTLCRDYGFKKGNYTIKVMAYDQNYHYHHAEGISSCGLVGGYGMFGSAAIDSVSFWIE